jgi:charged multivesicular body protein 6
MGFLFSQPKPAPTSREPTPAEAAELELKRAKVRLTKSHKRMAQEAETLRLKAVELAKAGRREDAVRFVQIRKLKMKAIANAEAGLLRLEEMAVSVETANQQMEIVDGLKAGTEALKRINEQMPIEKIHELLDESDEALAYQREVDEALARELGPTSAEELDEALEALMSSEAAPVTTVPRAELPVAPTHVPTVLPLVPSHTPARPHAAAAVEA